MPLELISKREGRVLKVLHEINAHIDEIARNTGVRDGLKKVSKRLEEIRVQLDESLYCLCDEKCDDIRQEHPGDEMANALVDEMLSPKQKWAIALRDAGVQKLEDIAGNPASQSSAKKHARHLIRKMKDRPPGSETYPSTTDMTAAVNCARARLSRTSAA